MSRPEHIAYYKNGRPFTDFLNQSKHDTSEEPSRSNSTNAVYQSTPETFSNEGAPNTGRYEMYPEPRRDDPGMSSSQVPGQVNTALNNSNTNSNDLRTRIRGSKRKRFHRLLDIGVPHEQAIELCQMNWGTLEQMPFVKDLLLKKASSVQRQGSLKEVPLQPQETDTPLFSTQGILGSLRVGIRNSVPMTEAQMKMVHHHLIVAITKQWADGGGPEFLGFFIKIDWILVTCTNQRSKDWLVNEVPFLEPWPGALLSIIPEKELPKPPRGLAFFPTSEAASFQDALDLIKAQNKGLNTELWKLLSEKIEEGGRTVTFYVDEPSAEALKAQDGQVALGFKMVTIKIKSINRTYTGYGTTTQNQVPTLSQGNKDNSRPQGSQSCGVSAQGRPLTSQDGTSTTRGYPKPQILETLLPSAGQTSFAKCSRPSVSRWDQPSAQDATGQMDLASGMFGSQPTQDSQSFTMPFTQSKSQGEPVIGREPTSSARGPQAAWEREGSWTSIDESQSKTPLIQGRTGRDRIVYDRDMRESAHWDRSAQASKGRNTFSRDDSYDTGTRFSDGKNMATAFTKPTSEVRGGFGAPLIIHDSQAKKTPLIQDKTGGHRTVSDPDMRASADWEKSAQASRGRNTFSRDDSYDTGTAFSHNENEGTGFTKPSSQVRGGFGTRPIILDSQSKNTPLIQDRTVFDQDMRASSDGDKSAHASRGRNTFSRDDSYDTGTAFSHNENEGTGFTKPSSQVRGGFGTRPIILDSQSKNTPLIQDRTVFDQDMRASSDGDKSAHASRGRNTFSGDDSYDTVTGFFHNENIPGFTKPTAQVRGGFGAPPNIQNSLSGMAPFNQSRNGEGDNESGQDGFSALAANGNQARDLPGRDTFGGDAASDWRGISGQHQAKSWFESRPIIRASQFGQDGNADKESDHSSGLASNQALRGESSRPSMQDARSRRSGNITQDTNGVDLTVVDMEESSGDEQPEEEGGYSTWIIEDPETYGNRLIQNDAEITGMLTAASGLLSPPGWNFISQNHDMTQFTQDNRDRLEFHGHGTSKSGKGLLPHPGSYGDGITDPKNPESFLEGRAGTDKDLTPGRGLLPHPKENYGPLIQDSKSLGGPFGDSHIITDRPSRGLLPHPKENYGPIQDSNSLGKPFGDSQIVMDRPSRGLLPHPSGRYGAGIQDSESQGISQGSKSLNEPRSDRGLLPHPRGYEARTQDRGRGRPIEEREKTGRESKDRRSSPQAKGSSARTQDSERHRRRSRSPQAWTESRGRFQGRERSSRDFRSDRLSPRTSQGRLQQDSRKSNRWDGPASWQRHGRDEERSDRGLKRPLDRQDSRDQRGPMKRLDTRPR